MNETKKQQVVIPKQTLKWVGIGVGAFIVIIVIGYLVFPILFGPKPEIVTLDGHGGLSGLNYMFNVDVTVKNNGREGWVRIYVELENAGRYEKQDRRLYLDANERKSTTFEFDTTLWGSLTSETSYRAWVTLD